jgi:hypothetical protein
MDFPRSNRYCFYEAENKYKYESNPDTKWIFSRLAWYNNGSRERWKEFQWI